MKAPASPQPLPPSFTGRNDSGKARTQQQQQKGKELGQGSSQGFAQGQSGQQLRKRKRTKADRKEEIRRESDLFTYDYMRRMAEASSGNIH